MQPAYLDGSVVLSVEMQTESALTITRTGSSQHFLPLRQLSRVVVVGDVNWSTRALGACMRANVPVLFLAKDGELLGVCSTLELRSPSLKHMLSQMLELPDIRSRMENWSLSQEARQRWLFSKAAGLPFDQMPPRQAYIQALDYLSMVLGYDAGRIDKVVSGQLSGALYEWLSKQGFGKHLVQGHEARLPLLLSYQKALRWYILRRLLDIPPDKEQLRRDCLRTATHWFHQLQPELQKYVTKLHGSLHSWCIGELVR